MQEFKWEELSKRTMIRQNETFLLPLAIFILQVILHRVKN